MTRTKTMAAALTAATVEDTPSKRPPSRRGKAVFPLYLEPDLHQRFRIAAADRGVSMQAAALEALERWLGG